jgi:hypothetical protein
VFERVEELWLVHQSVHNLHVFPFRLERAKHPKKLILASKKSEKRDSEHGGFEPGLKVTK